MEDYRIEMMARLIDDLKDKNYKIKSKDMAKEVVKMMDYISGVEYKRKLEHYTKEYRSFNGKV